jgi:fluoroacetyl-CoA thioesterase
MDTLRPGLLGQKEMVVEEKDLASVMGNVGAEVLSTHCVVLLMELASGNAVEDHLDQGQMVVGTWIGIRHLAAVPKGFRVTAESRLTEIQGRKLTFDVAAYDPYEKIAEGRNELLIVSADRFLERVKRKLQGHTSGRRSHEHI